MILFSTNLAAKTFLFWISRDRLQVKNCQYFPDVLVSRLLIPYIPSTFPFPCIYHIAVNISYSTRIPISTFRFPCMPLSTFPIPCMYTFYVSISCRKSLINLTETVNQPVWTSCAIIVHEYPIPWLEYCQVCEINRRNRWWS